MELLVTPAQVAQMAFRAPDFISPDAVPEATILAAQQKFVRPVLGDGLLDTLCGGAYPEFLADFVQPPLALYVKMLMLPSLADLVLANDFTNGTAAATQYDVVLTGNETQGNVVLDAKDPAITTTRQIYKKTTSSTTKAILLQKAAWSSR